MIACNLPMWTFKHEIFRKFLSQLVWILYTTRIRRSLNPIPIVWWSTLLQLAKNTSLVSNKEFFARIGNIFILGTFRIELFGWWAKLGSSWVTWRHRVVDRVPVLQNLRMYKLWLGPVVGMPQLWRHMRDMLVVKDDVGCVNTILRRPVCISGISLLLVRIFLDLRHRVYFPMIKRFEMPATWLVVREMQITWRRVPHSCG